MYKNLLLHHCLQHVLLGNWPQNSDKNNCEEVNMTAHTYNPIVWETETGG